MYREMLQKQRELNLEICHKFGLKVENLIGEYTAALLVEVGELANETKCFKFWREDKTTKRDRILEETSDVFHFILSLVIACKVEDEIMYDFDEIDRREENTTKHFLILYNNIALFNMGLNDDRVGLQSVMNAFIKLCHNLGITRQDLREQYLKKNEINLKRQEQHY